MSLYLWINLASISVPLVASFHRKIQFYREWKSLVPALVISAIPFLFWDEIFTRHGVWGFTPEYVVGIYLFNMPMEEWLFFLAIPYACMFTHYSLQMMLPTFKLRSGHTQMINIFLIALFALLAIVFYDRWYTFTVMAVSLVVLVLTMSFKKDLLPRFYTSFLIILVPFIIVNGILTGTTITDEVVWYNNAENMGARIMTIPLEDFAYAFALLLLNNFIYASVGSLRTRK